MFLSLLLVQLASAAPEPTPEATPDTSVLTVGIKESPPFTFKGPHGDWHGISYSLWKRVADDLEVEYVLEERDLAGMLEGLENGDLDVGVAALTVTASRELVMDFSHPFHSSGLGIATVPRERNVVLSFLEGLLSPALFKVVGGLTALLVFVGLLAWLFERKKNEEFGGTVAQGLFSGFWWSAVTMTTVGYGDKSPRTVAGRLLALVWMFASIIMISSFTAGMASALTVQNMERPVEGPEDLPDARVGSIESSTAAAWLRERAIAYTAYPTPAAAMQGLADDEVEALVYDAPILRYLALTEHPEVEVLDKVIQRENYGFALSSAHPLRDRINRSVLQGVNTPWWDGVLIEFLGN
jgi:ABC-type amino acid transport substrate-binding protein